MNIRKITKFLTDSTKQSTSIAMKQAPSTKQLRAAKWGDYGIMRKKTKTENLNKQSLFLGLLMWSQACFAIQSMLRFARITAKS